MGVGAIMEMDLPSNKARGMGTGTRVKGQGGSLKSRHRAAEGKGTVGGGRKEDEERAIEKKRERGGGERGRERGGTRGDGGSAGGGGPSG